MRREIFGINSGWGITAVRLAMAAICIVAGGRKWSGGLGVVIDNFAQIGVPLPTLAGPSIAVLELVGGLLLALGIVTRWLGLVFAVRFVLAAFFVKFPTQGWDAGRLDLLLVAGGVLLFLAGPGRAAVDEVWLGSADPPRDAAPRRTP